MNEVFLDIILIIFPILMFLVFSCFIALTNRKILKIVFLITILTSLYLGFAYGSNATSLILLCNIPVLICYFKKEGILGITISIIVIICSYYLYGINIYVALVKYLSYFIVYLLFNKERNFSYLFFRISMVIQGFFVSLEYFMDIYYELDRIIYLFIYVLVVYMLTFFSLYLFKLASNVSELYAISNKIQDENKLKDSLFKLTHEIKNPIAVCKGYLDMIDLDDVNKSKKYVEIIKSEIDRSLNVISDFMEYSKIKINKDVLDIVMLLEEIYDSFSLLCKSEGIKINFNSRDYEIYINGDYDRLKQVFINIIKNSIESITLNGIINIDIELDIDKVLIMITDNGIGMDLEELSMMKEMFYTTKKNGTGIGVALSNEIIEAHNGKLKYVSEKNKGTKAIISLPVWGSEA